jgi:hypothetical protein
MRTHVTFQADFPKDAGPDEPAGHDLAKYLASRLGVAGFVAGTPEVHEGYAYTFNCRQDKQACIVFVGLVDDGVQEWLVYAEPEVGAVKGWLRKVGLGSAKNIDSSLLGGLCKAIHQCLREDPRFESVRWYTTEGWDTNPDTGWTRTP